MIHSYFKTLQLVVFIFVSLFFVACKSTKIKPCETTYVAYPHEVLPQAKNVILLIGDGMGLAQIHAAMLAHQDKLNMESAQFIGLIDTRSADFLITDSGAGGTALACGVKTYNGAIGVDVDTVPVASILEKAALKGLSTGIVVSCNLTHATPASFYAHKPSRKMDTAIATDFYGKNITVAMGGGKRLFDQQKLAAEGYEVTTGMKELNASKADKLVAFYNDKYHPPKVSENRENWMPEATSKALSILSKNPKGFFLMIEGSQIDWGGHDNDNDYMVSETMDFDKTLGRVLDFAAKDKNTLVIVTADHETGALSILNQSANTFELYPHFASENHSGILVPVLSWGPAALFFSGFMDNTDIPKKIEAILQLNNAAAR